MRQRRLVWALTGLLLLPASAHALQDDEADPRAATLSGGPLLAEQAAYDVQSYDLALRIDPRAKSITGSLKATVLTTKILEMLVLDLDARLQVASITLGSEPAAAEWERRGDRLWIALGREVSPGETIVATIEYGGEPRVAPNPPWSGGFTWAETPQGAPWVAVSCQLDGADLWWPCKDHPSDEPERMTMAITIPKPLVCAANGTLVKVVDAEENGWRTHHWRIDNPINNYCVSVNIAPYVSVKAKYRSIDGHEMPVEFWVLPSARGQAQRLMPQILKELRFFEEHVGPYPFRNEKYGIAHTPYLGMEHQTIISYGSSFEVNEFGFDWLHLHELAHEWWGNLVTNADYGDFWIHEGFGTYMEVLAAEHFKGPDAGRRYVARLRRGINNRAPIAYREAIAIRNVYFVPPKYVRSDNDVYNKAALVLHTLRFLVGEKVFAESLKRMTYPTPEHARATDGEQCRFVTTAEYRKIVEELSERELGWFFDLYLYQPKLPQLIEERTERELVLRWETPDALPFPMPVEVSVGNRKKRLDPAEDGTMRVAVPRRAEVEIDPWGWILRDLPRPQRRRR